MEFKEEITIWLKKLQQSICDSLELEDGSATFTTDVWNREEGGGGISKILADGITFEKAGVGFSAVHGNTPPFLFKEKEHALGEDSVKNSTFFATGVSIVIHPKNPMVPIIHMNIRYFEMSNGTKWLGGGIDLTPHYIVKEDAAFFHKALKKVCDKYDPSYYEKFKNWADDYFYIPHRKETRGVGGVFFDRLTADEPIEFNKLVSFWKEIGETFAPTYVSLVKKNKSIKYTEKEQNWQYLRRGRYVEFNLVYDKGTKFGLETNGRIESILMSLPKYASWQYNVVPEPNSKELETLGYLKKGIDFINL